MDVKQNSCFPRRPYRLLPYEKSAIWGGSRLAEKYGKGESMNQIAETWECSVHPNGRSLIDTESEGCYFLCDFIDTDRSVMGNDYTSEWKCTDKPDIESAFPILVKMIDAASSLSVQVHPDDNYAAALENGQRGKNEAWYILESDPDAKIIFGLRPGTTSEEFLLAIEEGRISDCFNFVHPVPGELYYVEAGIVHAIGGGIVVVEVQQNSYITYRLFDYDRTDIHGKKRELHVEKGLAAIKYNLKGSVVPAHDEELPAGTAMEREVIITEYFCVNNIKLGYNAVHSVKVGENSFRICICIDGHIEMSGDDYGLTLIRGQSVFIPAGTGDIILKGWGELLLFNGGKNECER